MNSKLQIYLLSLLLLATSACSVTRHIEEEDLLLTRVRFEGVDNKDLRPGLRDNLGFAPNRKMFGFYPFYLQAWNLGKDGRDTNAVRRFLREKIGEGPSVLDSAKLDASVKQLELYLFNNGYFNSEVRYEVHRKRKKAVVTYVVKLNTPYTIAGVDYRVYDRDLHKIVMRDTAKTTLHSGDLFNTDLMSEERNRITSDLRNHGYYFFTREFVSFDVDSNQGNHQVEVAVEVKNPTLFQRHERYMFGKVSLDIDYPWYLEGIDDSAFTEIDGIFVRTKGMPIDGRIFPEYIPIRTGMIYSDQLVNNAYNRLYNLRVFGLVRIELVPDTAAKLVDVYITLRPDPEIDIGIEPQFITSDQSSSVTSNNNRIWGISGQLYFRNQNLFRGAEILDITYSGAAEFQYTNKTFSSSNLQQSLSASLGIPKMVWLRRLDWVRNRADDKGWYNQTTNFSLTFSYQHNRDFLQRTSLLTWAYGWRTGYNLFKVIPVEVNLNQVSIQSNILDNLTPGNQVLLASLLNPNFIPANRFEWFYDDKGLSRSGNFHRFRLSVEQAANLSYAVLKLGNVRPSSDGSYKVLDTRLFQYLKTDFDLRYYSFPLPEIKMAYRLRAAWAQPIGNSRVIPFDKRFFIGGANSLRGWKPRSIGPGSYNSGSSQIDRSGEVLLEGSAELRFRVIPKLLEGAVFLDGGNIWNVYADTSLPGANISLLFFNQLAFNTGIGFRFDLNFFIMRLDIGMQLRDPGYARSGGWVFSDADYLSRRTTLNFGIDYPF